VAARIGAMVGHEFDWQPRFSGDGDLLDRAVCNLIWPRG
jgi:hypothetical protein